MTATATQHLAVSALEQSPPTTRRTDVAEFRDGLRWARTVLDDPFEASVQASGMSAADLEAIERAARGSQQ
jgi:hypothetical protein